MLGIRANADGSLWQDLVAAFQHLSTICLIGAFRGSIYDEYFSTRYVQPIDCDGAVRFEEYSSV